MPLHLLGKKSWNVYNQDSIDRVRRDEANAKAREEADEQRMQDEDAARRIAMLRGEDPGPLPEPAADDSGPAPRQRDDAGIPRERKRRRLRGEDDTERDIRYAREDAESGLQVKGRLEGRKGDDAPLLDHAGHIQLVSAPDEKAGRRTEKNADAEAEKAKKRKREEDLVTMRFSNAAGYNNGMQKPWYAAQSSRGEDTGSSKAVVLAEAQGKDVWGNEDPRRREREMNRVASKDPFAMMQQAQTQLKQSEKDREKWQAGRERELKELERDQERDRRHRHKRSSRRRGGEDELEGFSLDSQPEYGRERRRDGERRHHHRHRRRSRERSRSRERRHRR